MVAQSLIFSKLYYNLSIWCSVPKLQIHKLTVFHIRVCKMLYRFNHKEPASDATVQPFVRILPPADHLRKSKLLCLGHLFVHGPPELLGVITSSLNSYLANNYSYSWLATLHQDLLWIAYGCPAFHFFLHSLFEISLTPWISVC